MFSFLNCNVMMCMDIKWGCMSCYYIYICMYEVCERSAVTELYVQVSLNFSGHQRWLISCVGLFCLPLPVVCGDIQVMSLFCESSSLTRF